ncbi:DUF5675 family protein [Sphingobacterium haloxyli]|uniref:DUF5675 domain-containing protein n=1 Tax=Sphingobacterium haloxyli TaxID=2100533 RepID=A0A2S9J5I7_9SPHI|nr:hypothetical protein C5745_05885 [Sphingobacterium haloxyli]
MFLDCIDVFLKIVESIYTLNYNTIRMGNNFSDTAGCLLVGKTKKYFKKSHEFEIRQSRKAYIPLYKRLAAMMERLFSYWNA